MTTCPTCKGDKSWRTRSTANWAAGPSKCPDCGGYGVINDDAAVRMQQGAELRKRRLAGNEGLRDAAKRLGMRPSELSDMERGRTQPDMNLFPGAVKESSDMKKWHVTYYYLATGMEGRADTRDLGFYEADTEEEALAAAAPDNGGDTWGLTAKEVPKTPDPHV